ncbi:MAG: alpha/beta hydrolase, partial [Deltaproteobacteria bacterium]|nr:alpha/beta hydrolase [Deltaproteobacteria bacterium]
FSVRREARKGIFDEETLREYTGWMTADAAGPAFLLRFYADYRVAPRRELAKALANIRRPVAVIWGERDIFLPVRTALELAAAMPDAELSLIEGAGHFIMEERPADVLRALEKLLARPA